MLPTAAFDGDFRLRSRIHVRMAHLERPLATLKRRLFVGELLRAAAGWIAGLLLTFGAAVLAVKLFAPRYWPDVLWLGLLVIPVAAIIVRQAVKRMPSDRDVVALLDRRLGTGGLLMTLAERPDPAWSDRLPAATAWTAALPRFRPVRFVRSIAVPLLFAVGAGFIPPRHEPPPPPRVTAGQDAAKELAETFSLLEQSDALDEESRTVLKQELDALASETQQAPLTHEKWETIDALRERLRAGLDATQLSVSRGQSAAAALAAAVGGQPLSVERTEQLNEALSEALETLRKNGAFHDAAGKPSAALPDELQALLKNGEFKLPSDARAREKSLADLKSLLDAESKRLAEARGACQQCLGGQGRPGDVFGPGSGTMAGQSAGKGGTSRGRGDAELTYGDESNEQLAKFREVVLPPGTLDRPNDAVPGVTASAPNVEPVAAEPRNAARDGQAATGKTVWNRPLRPRHRDVVRNYFGAGQE